jgi:hypothetical protein
MAWRRPAGPACFGDRRWLGGRRFGVQGVVPVAVDRVPLQRQGGEALFADRHPGRVVAFVEGGLDP